MWLCAVPSKLWSQSADPSRLVKQPEAAAATTANEGKPERKPEQSADPSPEQQLKNPEAEARPKPNQQQVKKPEPSADPSQLVKKPEQSADPSQSSKPEMAVPPTQRPPPPS